MTIRLLRTLVAVADTRTFGAAARLVHVTHAAVSQQMQTLEADLGVSLFDRTSRTPVLTPIGHQVVAKARSLIADYDALVTPSLAASGIKSTIRFGTLGTTLTGLTPQAMAVIKQRHPGVGLHIRPALTGAMLADIARRNLDAALITKPSLLPVDINFRHLVTEPMELIAAKEEPDDDPAILLEERPYIRFNRNAVLGMLIDNWILSRRLRVKESMELDSPEAIASMVQANLGVSVVPRLTIRPSELVAVKRVDLGADAPVRTLGLAWHREQTEMEKIEALFDAFDSVIRKSRDS